MNSDHPEKMKPDTIRINELCRELGVKAKSVIDYLPEVGITEKKTHSGSISTAAADKIRKHFKEMSDAPQVAEAKRMKGGGTLEVGSSSDLFLSEMTPAIAHRKSPLLRSPNLAVSKAPTILESIILRMPRKFTFHRGFVDFDFVFSCFDWGLKDVSVLIDFTDCESANYQALALLI